MGPIHILENALLYSVAHVLLPAGAIMTAIMTDMVTAIVTTMVTAIVTVIVRATMTTMATAMRAPSPGSH